jgi:hypothetical protein
MGSIMSRVYLNRKILKISLTNSKEQTYKQLILWSHLLIRPQQVLPASEFV